MKILIVPLRYYPESGASPSRWAALAETLAKMGNEVDCPNKRSKLSIREDL